MVLPKYTDPAVHNKTQDEAKGYIDNLHAQPISTGKNKEGEKDASSKKSITPRDKIKGYKEGTKDDNLPEDDDQGYEDIENDFADNNVDTEAYGKEL